MPEIVVSETTWLENIVQVEKKEMPGGIVILSYILANGHRYTIPLSGESLEFTRKLLSPVSTFTAADIPRQNGRPT